jgi:hypothetical protein
MFELKETVFPFRVYIVRYRRPTQLNGLLENLLEHDSEPLQFPSRKPPRYLARADPSAKEAFIGVDVSYSGQQFLVQQSCLDCQFPSSEKYGELLGPDRKRLRARSQEPVSFTEIAKFQSAKPPRVHKTEFAATRQRKPRVGVLCYW